MSEEKVVTEVEAEVVASEIVESENASQQLTETVEFGRLTKRNQQYMLTLDRHLSTAHLSEQLRQEIYTEMCSTLEEGQHTGQTARQLYGTPTECAQLILQQQFPDQTTAEKSPDWQIAVDGALILGSIFTLISGISLLRQNGETTQSVNLMGLLTLIVNYIVAGLSMLVVSKVLPDMKAPRGQRGYVKYFTVSTLAMLVWVGAVLGSSIIIPRELNPYFTYEVYFIIGALTLGARFYLKRKWNIRGGLF